MLTKAAINNFLAGVYHLNHPYLTLISALALLAIGFSVFLKNRRSRINQLFLILVYSIVNWFIGNVLSMIFHDNFELGFLGLLIGYSSVPFMPVVYYHFFLAYTRKKSSILPILYFTAFLQTFLLWLWATSYGKAGVIRILSHVGVIWDVMHPLYFALFLFGMAFYILIALVIVFSFLRESMRETAQVEKRRLKVFAIAFFFLTGGGIEWLVIFGIDLHICWPLMPLFFAAIGFAIVRYRALDIETVIHRTFLWLLASYFIVVPIGVLVYTFHPYFSLLSWWQMTLIFTAFFYASASFYRRMQGWIDHLFRRKRYDPYEALGKISSRLAMEADIVSISRKLFFELRDTLYIRNAVLLMEITERSVFEEIDRMGFEELKRKGIAVPEARIALEGSSNLINWFRGHLKAMENDQLKFFDSSHDGIKDAASGFFNDNALEILIPITMEGELKGLLGLGKKETLKSYTARDIQLLENLGRQISIVLNSALRHKDLMEKELLNNVTNGIDEGLMLIDNAGKIFWVNEKLRKIFEAERTEMMGRHYCDIFPCESAGSLSCLKEAAIKDVSTIAPHRMPDKDGQERFYEFSVHAIKNETGAVKYFLHISRDLTHRLKLEEEIKLNYQKLTDAYEKLKETQSQLIQAEKMEAIGRMASGIAHEVKNPLGIVLQGAGCLEDMLCHGKGQEGVLDVIQIIKNNVKRADNIISTLVDFSRRAALDISAKDINSTIESSIELVLHSIKLKEIEIVRELQKDIPRALFDGNKMTQVFVNLFLNAIYAMPQGGKLFIRSYAAVFDQALDRKSAAGSERLFKIGEKTIVVEIEDTGIGIPEENIDKIFEPFFTTKEPGEGTGLGLSITKNLIDTQGCLINIKSKVEKGTNVIITLKAAI